MKKLVLIPILLSVAACQTAQTGPAPAPGRGAVAAEQSLPPIYEPLVDMHRVKPAKFERDLAACRRLAAPQERAARAAQNQAQTGAALSAIGSVVSAVPVSTFRQARALGATSDALQDAGDANHFEGSVKRDDAVGDYMLVVNTCLSRRGYVILR